MATVGHHAHPTLRHLGPHGPARRTHGASAIQLVGFHHQCRTLRHSSFRAGLHDVDLTVGPIFGPLDVHRPTLARALAVMVLNLDGSVRQHQNIGIAQAVAHPVRAGRGAVDHRFACAARRVNHMHLLLTQRSSQDTAKAQTKGGLVHIKLVGIHRALHHVFPQPPSAGDEHHVWVTRLGVDGEHDAAGREVAAHHLHHPHRERDLEMIKALVRAVRNGPVGEQ